MKTVAVVPVNSLERAKSRLAGVMSPQERAALMLRMLDHVLQTIALSGVAEDIALISPDEHLPHLPRNVEFIRQTRVGLNNLLEQGREWAIAEKADALMVVFADLPLLSPGNLLDIEELGEGAGTLVLAPDRHEQGTNIMLAHPVSLARFAFGPDSYNRHRATSLDAGVWVETYHAIGTALDVDTPDDLHLLETEQLTLVEY